MEMLQIIGLGLVAVTAVIVLKVHRPEIAMQVGIVAGIVIFILIAGKLCDVINLILGYAKKVNIDMAYLTIILRIIGIAYVTEFGAEVCRDAGEASIASKIELAGKVMIAVIGIPVITSLLDLIVKIMP